MVSLIRHIDHEAFKHLLSCLFASTFALKAVSSTDLIRELMFFLLQTLVFTLQYIYLHNPRPHNEFKLWSSRTWWSSRSRNIKVVQPSRRSHPRRQPNLVLKKVFYSFPIKAVYGVVLSPSPMVLVEVFIFLKWLNNGPWWGPPRLPALEMTLICFIYIFHNIPCRPVAIFAVTQFRGRSNRCSCQILSKYWSLLYQNRDSLLQALTSPHGAFLSQKSLCLSRFWENKKPDVTLCAMILYKSIQEGTAQRRGKVNLKLSEKVGHIYDI